MAGYLHCINAQNQEGMIYTSRMVKRCDIFRVYKYFVFGGEKAVPPTTKVMGIPA